MKTFLNKSDKGTIPNAGDGPQIILCKHREERVTPFSERLSDTQCENSQGNLTSSKTVRNCVPPLLVKAGVDVSPLLAFASATSTLTPLFFEAFVFSTASSGFDDNGVRTLLLRCLLARRPSSSHEGFVVSTVVRPKNRCICSHPPIAVVVAAIASSKSSATSVLGFDIECE